MCDVDLEFFAIVFLSQVLNGLASLYLPSFNSTNKTGFPNGFPFLYLDGAFLNDSTFFALHAFTASNGKNGSFSLPDFTAETILRYESGTAMTLFGWIGIIYHVLPRYHQIQDQSKTISLTNHSSILNIMRIFSKIMYWNTRCNFKEIEKQKIKRLLLCDRTDSTTYHRIMCELLFHYNTRQ